jgi:signal transduction histidine kinase/ligand-binding sensor domain-containing protein
MKSHPRLQTSFSVLLVAVLSFVSALAAFLAQASQTSPSPTPTPEASPTVSPSPSPTPTPLPGAQNFHQWGSITVFNGLPSDSVRAIAQTPDGVMWFGTDNGLARFDGRRIQKFSVGTTSSQVTALKITTSGKLIVGTQSGAYIGSTAGFRLIDGTLGVRITVALCDAEILLGTDDGRVLRVRQLSNDALTTESMNSEPIRGEDGSPSAITSLIKIDQGVLAGTSGRGVFNLKDSTVSELRTTPRPIFVNAIAKTESGTTWLGTDAARSLSGLFALRDGGRAERIAAPTSRVLALEAGDSGLWAGTERFGLFHVVDGKLKKIYTFENTSGGLRSNTIYALFTDREGVLWIGTNRGVSRFDQLGAFQQTVSEIPNSNFIRTLYQVNGENGQLYAGSNRGLFVCEKGDTWTEIAAFRNKAIYSILPDKPTVLVGTSDGIYDFGGHKLLDGDVRGLKRSDGRDYAAVFGRGVFDITGSRPQLIFGNGSVTSIFPGPARLFIGTAGEGLFSYNGQSVRLEAAADVLKTGTIWNMYQADPAGPLYLAGEHGVFLFNDDGGEQIIAADDVRDVFVRDGQVWAATTTRGLLHARLDERFGWLVTTIGFEQGLPSEKAFSILPIDGSLLVATNRGVVSYRPGTVAPKIIPTRVLSQRAHDVDEVTSTIPLDYPQNSLLVEVAGQSSRTFPEEFQYAFILTNAKGEVVDQRLANDPQYAPADLKPGDYAIEAVAFDRDLLASEPLTIRFSVAKAPFPWTAAALAVLLAIAVAGLVWAVYEHWRIRQRNRELAAARLDLANEAERVRSRIARDLHDQTLADLRTLLMRSDKGELSQADLRQEIESVSTEIRRICEDLSPSVLENVGLVPALEFLLAQTIDDHIFSADEGVDEQVVYPINVQLQIYRIAQEVLTNIRRHSNADLVEMKISTADETRLLLTISDNGNVFAPDTRAGKGRGIANIRSRANLIGARVAWAARPEGGNVFSLSIEPQ